MQLKQIYLTDFIRFCHKDQLRKYTGDPYWTHPVSVAKLVEPYNIPFAVEIALCHDLLEDTDCTADQLHHYLLMVCRYKPEEVVSIVSGVKTLTDEFTHEKYPDLNRKERKAKELNRFTRCSSTVQSVKYADIVDNTKSIRQYDKNFAPTYLSEVRAILNKLQKGNPQLRETCLTLIAP